MTASHPPRLSEEEMVDLRSARYFLSFAAAPADVDAGRNAFTDKGCGACHGVHGTATNPGQAPDLAKSELLATDSSVASAVWNHLPKMYARMEEQSRAWPSFAPGEFANLVAYLRSLEK